MTLAYSDDLVTLYHGDCRDMVLPHVDLLCTDPPYGLGGKLAGGTWGAKLSGGFSWDQEAPDIAALVALGTDAIVWGGNYFALPPRRCWLVWRKPDAVATMADVDFAWTTFDKPSRCFSWSIAATNKERVAHPTQKPLALMSWCLSLAPAATTVLDPFAGSGTTLRAAKDRGIQSFGVEREERFCEIIADRCRQEVLDLGGAA